MNGKVFRSSQLSVAVAAVLAFSGAVAPGAALGKARSNAIIGTGADAIIGTGRAKSSTSAIIGTGADAIIGTGRAKSSTNAIIGTGADAIIGTGKPAVLMLGPVDVVNVADGTIQVLGRSLRIATADKIASEMTAGRQLEVAVFGVLSSSGTVKKATLRMMPIDYVAGSSKVVVTGRVTQVDASTATVTVGQLKIDVSGAGLARLPAVGDMTRVLGTQPLRGGIVLAEKAAVR